jgi:hypothetical protein
MPRVSRQNHAAVAALASVDAKGPVTRSKSCKPDFKHTTVCVEVHGLVIEVRLRTTSTTEVEVVVERK